MDAMFCVAVHIFKLSSRIYTYGSYSCVLLPKILQYDFPSNV